MALDNFRKTSMRIDKANQRFLDYQNAKVGDINGRELLVQITNNGVVEDQTGTTLKLNWKHENGNQGSTNFKAVDIKTGKYSLYYPSKMLYKGTVDASVEINSNGQTTNTMNFKIIVHADVFNGEAGTVNGAFISLADVNKKLDDREKEYVELKSRQTSVETQFNSVQQELTDKDIVSAPEIIAARNGEENLKARLDREYQEVSTQLAQTSENFVMRINEESAGLGAEMVTGTGWTSAGWAGNYATGFTHSTGNTTPLTYNLGATAGEVYLVELTVDDTDLMNSGFKFAVTIGDSAVFQMYQGTGGSIFYSKGIKAVNNGDLKIIPNSDFTGTVKGVSVKPVTGTIDASTKIKDSTDKTALEIRPTKESLNNVFIGKNAGQKNVSGMENTIIGNNAMENSVTGFWNSALGTRALLNNVNGSRSIALGYRALEEMISGHRNIAVGTFALHRVTTGANNIGIGADSAWHTTTGEGNIAIGTVSLDNNTTGSFNIAIGYNALRDNETTSFNVAIGHHALRMAKQNNNTAIGAFALSETVGSGGQTAIGYQALKVSTGTNNTAIGQQTALNLKGGNDNTVIGRIGLLGLTTGTGNTVIGSSGARYMTEGSRNTLIGNEVGRTLTSGNENILIGNRVTTPTAETNNHLNIGNLIYGDLATKRIGIGLDNPLAKLHLGAGTTSVPPMRINGGTLLTTTMSGAIESDGSYLYFTNSAGNRLRIVAENVS